VRLTCRRKPAAGSPSPCGLGHRHRARPAGPDLRRLPPGRRHHQPAYGGTGLGLSISRDLATLLGGTITSPARRARAAPSRCGCRRTARAAGPPAPQPAARPPPAPPPGLRRPLRPGVAQPRRPASPTTAQPRKARTGAGDRGRIGLRAHPVRPGARAQLPLPGRARPKTACAGQPACRTPSCSTCACPTAPACRCCSS
jgi:hypothetical protein